MYYKLNIASPLEILNGFWEEELTVLPRYELDLENNTSESREQVHFVLKYLNNINCVP